MITEIILITLFLAVAIPVVIILVRHVALHQVYVTYTKWINSTSFSTMLLEMKFNTSLYKIMERAATRRPKQFQFNATYKDGFGYVVNAIGGLYNNASGDGKGWKLYKMALKTFVTFQSNITVHPNKSKYLNHHEIFIRNF